MRVTILVGLLLAACASVPVVENELPPVAETTANATTAAEKETKEPTARRKRAESAKRPTTATPLPTSPATEPPPKCDVDLSDPRAAFLQKLDCVLETADLPAKTDK